MHERASRQPSARQTATPDELRAAVEHHRAGRLDKAEDLYRRALRRHPDHPDILHLLGALALDHGKPERAIQLIGKALQALPNFAAAHSNLGNALRAAGRPAEAAASYSRAIALRPDFAAAHSNLGRLLGEQGDHAGALEHCDQALRLDPALAEAQINRGHALRALGRIAEAERAFREALVVQPGSVGTLHALGVVLAEGDRLEEARSCQDKVLARRPDHPQALLALGSLLRRAGDLPAAVAACRRAVEVAPAFTEGWIGLGNALRSIGQFEEAVACYRRALAINPDAAEAHRGLALTGVAAAPTDAARLAAILHNTGASTADRISAGFALGRVLDDQDRFDEAFACYADANALFRESEAEAGRRFDAEPLRQHVDRIIQICTTDAVSAQRYAARPSGLPVFIVGMPRSGTSLIEQIVASHSQVFGAGELGEVGRIATRLRGDGQAVFPLRDPAEARSLADAHLDRLRALGGERARVVDKMPDNIFELALIAALFPGARVILSNRDPRDTCLSCFFQRFSGSSQLFSYDLLDCGRRYLEQQRLVAHWRQVLPLRMIEVEYETLVADLETEARRLIAFLGLPWEAACLDFHRTDRAVLTASSWQVRQPLYTRSVGRWRAYQAHLGPLLRLLDAAEPN